jgi:hypothetical protein
MAATIETHPEPGSGPLAGRGRVGAHDPRFEPEAGRAPAIIAAVGMLVALGLALWLLAGLWGPNPPSGDDTMAHLVRAEFTIRQLSPHFKLDGWQPQFGTGYQQFLFYGPGFTWLVALVHALSFGTLSIPGAFTVASALSYLALPPSVAYLAASFGLGRRAAGIAAILSLCVASPYGSVGLPGTFGVGLIPAQLGGACFCLALGAILRVAAEPTRRRVMVAGAALAALFVTHAISALILAVFLVVIVPALLVTDRASGARLRGLAGAVALAAGLAGFWLVPSFAHRDLRGILTSWINPLLPQRLGELFGGRILFHRGVIWVLMGGLAFGAWRVWQGRRWALGLVAAPLAYLVIADLFLRWNPQNLVSVQLMNRGLGYVGVLLVLPLAVLLATVARTLRWWHVGDALALAGAVALVLVGGSVRGYVHQQTPASQLRAMAGELARVVPDGARFATQREWPQEIGITGVTMPDNWLAWASGRDTLNIFNVESSTSPGPDYEPDRMTSQGAAEAARELLRLGVTHVALTDEAAAKPMATSQFFQVIWRDPPMAVLAVRPVPGWPSPGSLLRTDAPAEAHLIRGEAEHLEIAVQSDRRLLATVAVGWSPKWHAWVNGTPARLARSPEGLILLPLPPGASTVVLRFQQDGWDWLGIAATVATLLGLLGWPLLRRRSGKGAGQGPGAGVDAAIDTGS